MQLSQLKGLGSVRLNSLRAAGIVTPRDFLQYLPVRYKDTQSPVPIRDLILGEKQAVQGYWITMPRLNRYKGLTRVTGCLRDETGSLQCVWFNQPWMAGQLVRDAEMILYGRVENHGGRMCMINPSVEKERAILPVYKPLPSLPSGTIAGLIAQVLCEQEQDIPEMLPTALRERHGLISTREAIREAHFPQSRITLAAAERCIAFEKALMYIAGADVLGDRNGMGAMIQADDCFAASYWRSLPFRATEAQKRVLDDILCDMAAPEPMARLVQGDVGCGKTAVAMGALLSCACSGFQCALMAPTEILAQQHYANAKALFEPLGIRVGFLHGGLRSAQRKEAMEKTASGEWEVLIGTHALISSGVAYRNLGLVITDEQHRFGVGQRTALIKKSGHVTPNLLVMSATPIPRTLALILYGDLDISIIDEMPPGRLPATTRLVPEAKRDGMYRFIREETAKGRQTYIVCPLIEESDRLQNVKAARSHHQALQTGPLRGLRFGLVYGGQAVQDKQIVMQAFERGDTDILVSTTVIEVGVNVPNASIMVVEDAHRFGLSQLHQLRGRVGRGGGESWCFLLSEPNERLQTLAATQDGFIIAQKDLEMRGPGEIFGTRQHGSAAGMDFSGIGIQLLEEVRSCYEDLTRNPIRAQERAVIHANVREHMQSELAKISFS